MKLVALTYGTEGDTRPIAAVCRALMDAGHDVTLLADGGTLGSARDLGVPHAALAGNIRGALQLGISSTVAGKDSLHATAQAVARIANENADAWMRQVLRSCGRQRRADRRRSRRIHRLLGGGEAGCSRHRRGNDSAHADLCFSIAVPAARTHTTMAQPFQLSPRRRSFMARIS